MERQLNILVVVPSLPEPDKQAGDRRLFAMMEMLAKKHKVDLCSVHDSLEKSGLSFEEHSSRLAQIGVRLLPLKYRFCDSVSGASTSRYYDIGIFEFFYIALDHMPEFKQRNPKAKVIIDSVDVHFFREAIGITIGVGDNDGFLSRKSREIEAYQGADSVIVVSTLDEEMLQKEGVTTPLSVIPIIVPTVTRISQKRNPIVLFIGGFSHPPNVDGITWFGKTVWEQIKQAVPDAILTVVGSNVPDDVKQLEKFAGVQVVGYAPDTKPYLDDAAGSVAPLRFGGGMKGKVCEAMAAGLPVVTTSVGAQGLGIVPGKHLLQEEVPALFASAVIKLLREPELASDIGIAGQQHISKICDPDVIEVKLNQLVEDIASPPNLSTKYLSPLRHNVFQIYFGIRCYKYLISVLLQRITKQQT